MNKLYPLRFVPVYKDYLWGGHRIPERFNRPSAGAICAESWEISTHPDGPTPIANGPLAGRTLDSLPAEHAGETLFGRRAPGGGFPLLIKLIDAREILSVQVHPDAAGAAASGGEPKTEMWYFLEGGPGAFVYCGLKPGTGPEALRKALGDSTAADLLNRIPAVPGEAVFVPGGQVHAIGAGCLLLEVQQRSNTTYRLYDWDRTGPDGQPRELHTDKAMQVINWTAPAGLRCAPRPFTEGGANGEEICRSAYFRLDRFRLSGPAVFRPDGSTFHALFIADGGGTLEWPGGKEPLAKGETWFVPAGLPEYRIAGSPVLLRVTLP